MERYEKHRAETGHPVELQLTVERTWSDIKEMTGLAHPVLLRTKKRGW